MQPAFVSVLDVVEMTPDRELNVAACDDLAAQDRVTVAVDAGCMVSRCHAGDVDSGDSPVKFKLPTEKGDQNASDDRCHEVPSSVGRLRPPLGCSGDLHRL